MGAIVEVIETESEFSPKGPRFFFKSIILSSWNMHDVHLFLAWFFLGIGAAWRLESQWLNLTKYKNGDQGFSLLPSSWGVHMNADDLASFILNADSISQLLGLSFFLLTIALLILILIKSWKIQAQALQVRGAFAPWALGFLDALVLGLIPTALLTQGLISIAQLLWYPGMIWTNWSAFVLTTWATLFGFQWFNFQWWIARGYRALDIKQSYSQHLKNSFFALWSFPFQWSYIGLSMTLIRAFISYASLWAAWRIGGLGYSWILILGIHGLVTALNVHLLRTTLKTSAQFILNREEVRFTIASLQEGQ